MHTTQHTHTHTRAQARARAHIYTHTRTRTHILLHNLLELLYTFARKSVTTYSDIVDTSISKNSKAWGISLLQHYWPQKKINIKSTNTIILTQLSHQSQGSSAYPDIMTFCKHTCTLSITWKCQDCSKLPRVQPDLYKKWCCQWGR